MNKKLTKYFIAVIAMFVISVAVIIPVSAEESSNPLLIYLERDFEDQVDGDVPYGLWSSGDYHNQNAFRIASFPTNNNPDNKVVRITHNADSEPLRLFHYIGYAPVSMDFVLSFDFNLEKTNYSQKVDMRYDAVLERHSRYDEGNGMMTLLELSKELKVCGKSVYTGVEKNTWYSIDLKFNIGTSSSVDVYLNGECVKAGVLLPKLINVASFHFYSPETGENGDWYIDNIKNYISETIVDEDEFENWCREYEACQMIPIPKYSAGRGYCYEKFVFAAAYDVCAWVIGGQRYYADNTYHKLPTEVYENEDTLFFPVRALAQMSGATIEWDNELNGFNLRSDKNEAQIIIGEEYYVLNGKTTKHIYPAELKDGSACMAIEELAYLLGITYEVQDDLIIFDGELKCPWDLGPMINNTDGRTLEQEIIYRLKNALAFALPTPEDVKTLWYDAHSDNEYKRLYFPDFDEVINKMNLYKNYRSMVNAIIKKADNALDQALPTYATKDYKRAAYPSEVATRAYNLAFAYKVTGDEKYKERLWQDMYTVSEFPDFHPAHFLNVGNMADGLGIAYNWLYEDWSEEELEIIEKTILRNIFAAYEKVFSDPIYGADTALAYGAGNMPIVVQNGLLKSCSALFYKHPERCSELVSAGVMGVSPSFDDFAPDGAWKEGISYWRYTMDSLPFLLGNLDEELGTDFGFSKARGLQKSFYYPLALESSGSPFMFGDATKTIASHPSMMWAANKFGDEFLASIRNNGGTFELLDLIYYVDTGDYVPDYEVLQNDFYWRNDESVQMKSGWNKTDTTLALHGGTTTGYHGHADNGSFQFDMFGERWADEVPKEDYVVRDSSAGGVNAAYSGGYYRSIAEGHNVVCADLGSTKIGMEEDALSEIVAKSFNNTESFAIIDLKATNKIYKSALRAAKLNKVTNEVLIQDEFVATKPTEFWWFMQTMADIELSEDKKTAILTKKGKKITAQIISGGEETFQILEAKRLPGYGEIAPYETPNDGYLRLAIQKKNSDEFNVAVLFRPFIDGAEIETAMVYEPIRNWQGVNLDREKLSEVKLNGEHFEEFNPDVYNYEIVLPTQESPIPELSVVAENEECELYLTEVKQLPGVAHAILKKAGKIVGQYSFTFVPINDTTKFLNERQIPIMAYTVTSEPQEENGAKNLFDADHTTKYATNEIGGTLTLDFGNIVELYEVKMAFLNGASRQEYFKIAVSEDGENYTEVYDGASSGKTTDYENFVIGPINARYMQVSFYGNTNSAWVSVTELCVFTK